MKTDNTLTATRLRELMVYRDGALYWRNPHGRRKKGALGAPAGRGRRLQTPVEGAAHYVHRLVWLYHHGDWPTDQVDHINGDRLDNRIENLRVVTNAENRQNVPTKGVSFDSRKASRPWRARIMVNGKSISLGYHDTEVEARAEYQRAKRVYHPAWVTGVGRAA